MRMLVIAAIVASAVPAHADGGDGWDAVTIAGQAGGGIGGGIVLGSAGFFIGAGIGEKSSRSGDWGAPLLGGVIGGAVGAVTGVTLGVQITGDVRGGAGNWAATAAGAVIGGMLTAATLPQYVDRVPQPVAFVIGATTLVGPAIVGYQLSNGADAGTEPRVMVPLMIGAF